MEVSAEREQSTAICQALPAAAVSPEATRETAPGLSRDPNPEAGTQSPSEMTPERAADEPVAGDPLYHRPVYSAAYFGSGGLPGPRAANDAHRQSPPRLHRSPASPPQERARGNGPVGSPSRQEEATLSCRREGGASDSLPNDAKHVKGPARGAFATVKVRSEARPTPLRALDSPMESWGRRKAERVASTDVFHNPTGQPESAAVTMIFMGYENAPDEEEADGHAELVTVGCSDDDDDDDDKVASVETQNSGGLLSYHPEGYKSKVFRPDAAKSRHALRGRAEMTCNHLALRKPTFIHKSASQGPV